MHAWCLDQICKQRKHFSQDCLDESMGMEKQKRWMEEQQTETDIPSRDPRKVPDPRLSTHSFFWLSKYFCVCVCVCVCVWSKE